MKKLLIAMTLLICLYGSLFAYADLAHIGFGDHKQRTSIQHKNYPAEIDSVLSECVKSKDDKKIILRIKYLYPRMGMLECTVYDEQGNLIGEKKAMRIWNPMNRWYTQKEYEFNKGYVEVIDLLVESGNLSKKKKNRITIKTVYKDAPTATRFGVKEHAEEQEDTITVFLEKVDKKWVAESVKINDK